MAKKKKVNHKKISSVSSSVTKVSAKPLISAKWLFPLALVGILIIGLSAGVGIWKLTKSSGSLNSGRADFPAFVYDKNAPKDTPKAYQAAVDYSDDFSQIPCYCGCGQHSAHDSLRACFISLRKGDTILYDNHGAG
jgi:hypothetical protein